MNIIKPTKGRKFIGTYLPKALTLKLRQASMMFSVPMTLTSFVFWLKAGKLEVAARPNPATWITALILWPSKTLKMSLFDLISPVTNIKFPFNPFFQCVLRHIQIYTTKMVSIHIRYHIKSLNVVSQVFAFLQISALVDENVPNLEFLAHETRLKSITHSLIIVTSCLASVGTAFGPKSQNSNFCGFLRLRLL